MVAREDDNQVAVLDEVLTRFVNAYVQGEEPDLDEFVQQYPTYEALIRRRIKGLREIDGLFDSLAQADESDFDTSAPAHDLVGRKLANFEIEKVIGRGGMGVVYLARDTKLKRHVAIKSLPAGMLANATSQSRFRREAEVLASLNHSGIAVIYDILEQEDGTDYLVLEYVPGENLSTYIADKTLKPEDVLSIGGQIAEAVCAAHDKGVVHRDLKPGNIRITPEGRVKVLDFGLAKSTGQDVQSNQTTATGAGRLMGTPAYMSPEQVRGKRTDHRTDIWSFGCVLYEMLTSRRPFEGETVSDTIARTLEREPDWGLLPRQTPENIQVLIQRCLNKDPQARLQRIGDAAAEIQEKLNPATGSSTLSPARRLGPVAKARRQRTVAITLVTLLVAVSLLAARLLWPGAPEAATNERTLVVLPFENIGPNEDEELAERVTNAITARLAGIHGLGVISGYSAAQYRGQEKTIQQIGEELGVDHILRGTIEREQSGESDGQLRVIPQLIRVSDRRHIWAETYDSDTKDMFQVQSDLAERIAQALDITLPSESRPTGNTEAYDYYLRGYSYMERGCHHENNARIALEMLQKAVDLDPTFALAWSRLSETHMCLYWYGYDRTQDRLDTATYAVEKARGLAPDDPETHRALGIYYYWGHLDYDSALKYCALALKSRPNDHMLFVFEGAIRRRQGKMEEALASFEKAAELDPLASLLPLLLAETHALLRDYPESQRYCERAISLSPEITQAYGRQIRTLLSWYGDTELARSVLSRARDHVDIHEDHLLAYNAVLLDIFDGDYQQARKFLAEHDSEVLETQFFVIPKSRLQALTCQLEGNHQAELDYHDAARMVLEAKIEQQPDDPRLHSALGLAYAGLGREEDAVREGQLAVDLLPETKEALVGLWRLEDLARIYVMVGRFDAAVEIIQHLLSVPGELSVPLLKVDPVWDPLRDRPRFQRLVE